MEPPPAGEVPTGNRKHAAACEVDEHHHAIDGSSIEEPIASGQHEPNTQHDADGNSSRHQHDAGTVSRGSSPGDRQMTCDVLLDRQQQHREDEEHHRPHHADGRESVRPQHPPGNHLVDVDRERRSPSFRGSLRRCPISSDVWQRSVGTGRAPYMRHDNDVTAVPVTFRSNATTARDHHPPGLQRGRDNRRDPHIPHRAGLRRAPRRDHRRRWLHRRHAREARTLGRYDAEHHCDQQRPPVSVIRFECGRRGVRRAILGSRRRPYPLRTRLRAPVGQHRSRDRVGGRRSDEPGRHQPVWARRRRGDEQPPHHGPGPLPSREPPRGGRHGLPRRVPDGRTSSTSVVSELSHRARQRMPTSTTAGTARVGRSSSTR